MCFLPLSIRKSCILRIDWFVVGATPYRKDFSIYLKICPIFQYYLR